MLALNPISLTPSHREPFKLPQDGSLPTGSNVSHICLTRGLIPKPRGSQGVVPRDPQFVPDNKLKVVGTGGFVVESAWQAALQTLKCKMPFRISAEGTAAS